MTRDQDDPVPWGDGLDAFCAILGQTIREICRADDALPAELQSVRDRISHFAEWSLHPGAARPLNEESKQALVAFLLVLDQYLTSSQDPLIVIRPS